MKIYVLLEEYNERTEVIMVSTNPQIVKTFFENYDISRYIESYYNFCLETWDNDGNKLGFQWDSYGDKKQILEFLSKEIDK